MSTKFIFKGKPVTAKGLTDALNAGLATLGSDPWDTLGPYITQASNLKGKPFKAVDQSALYIVSSVCDLGRVLSMTTTLSQSYAEQEGDGIVSGKRICAPVRMSDPPDPLEGWVHQNSFAESTQAAAIADCIDDLPTPPDFVPADFVRQGYCLYVNDAVPGSVYFGVLITLWGPV